MSMQKMVANRLLKGWLKKIDLEEGELRSSLMMYEEDGKTHLVSVTLRLNADGKVEVARVIQNINIDDVL